jgi:hypothetical protein
VSRRTTKQRRAARIRKWRCEGIRNRLRREAAGARGGFADLGDFLVAMRTAVVSGRVDPRLIPIAPVLVDDV